MSSLQPPEPPTGDPNDPDSGWTDYYYALEEHKQAVLREQLLATGVQWAIRNDEPELALALLDADIVNLRPASPPGADQLIMDIEASVDSSAL